MDGNGRWATQRGLSRSAGHRRGADTLVATVRSARKMGIEVLTVYAFSAQNWQRPSDEVEMLMDLLLSCLRGQLRELIDNGVRLRTIGDVSRLPSTVRAAVKDAVLRSRENRDFTLCLALSYGGREEICGAARAACKAASAGLLDPDELGPEQFRCFLQHPSIPDPDLVIRTSGEMRVSNFLLWQIAYSELFVTDTLWPDFSDQDLLRAVQAYALRERRFGKTSEQLKSSSEHPKTSEQLHRDDHSAGAASTGGASAGGGSAGGASAGGGRKRSARTPVTLTTNNPTTTTTTTTTSTMSAAPSPARTPTSASASTSSDDEDPAGPPALMKEPLVGASGVEGPVGAGAWLLGDGGAGSGAFLGQEAGVEVRRQLRALLESWRASVSSEPQEGPLAVPVLLSERQRWLPLLGWGPWLIPGVDGTEGSVLVALDVGRAHRLAGSAAAVATGKGRTADAVGKAAFSFSEVEDWCRWKPGSLLDPSAWKWALEDSAPVLSPPGALMPPPWEYGDLFFGAAGHALDAHADPARSRAGTAVRIRRWVRWAVLA
jgi:undecaprenyl diphosphate synthase